ncbi:MAG: cyclophilin-like fold protein, partial [Candidatus Thorarchaeota archaeon]
PNIKYLILKQGLNMSNSGELLIKMDLFGIGTAKGKIIRYLAPLTSDAIIDRLPITLRGRFSFGKKAYWTLPGIEIYQGTNQKSLKEAKKGDIVYNPKTDELIFTLEDYYYPNKVNKVGEISENIDIFLGAKNGLNTKISKL